MATSALMTDTGNQAIFEQVLYIQYLIQFCQKNNEDKEKDITALIDLVSKINIIYFVYITKLGFCARKVNISAQKINKSYLNIFRMVIVDYLIKHKLKKI